MNIIDTLRQQHPILTHTSWQPLNVIKPHFNIDTYLQNSQNIVCATSDKLQRDFYALRCNEYNELINHAISIEKIKFLYLKRSNPIIINMKCHQMILHLYFPLMALILLQ